MPLEGFDETGVTDNEAVKKQLCDGVQTLERAGADFIIIACNTVHVFLDDMQKAVSIPIVSMIDEVVQYLVEKNIDEVGLLSSETTRELNFYGKAMKDAGIHMLQVTPEDQKQITEVIKHVMGGMQSDSDSGILSIHINSFGSQGVACAVLGCTELPLAAKNLVVKIPVYDATSIVIQAALQKAYS